MLEYAFRDKESLNTFTFQSRKAEIRHGLHPVTGGRLGYLSKMPDLHLGQPLFCQELYLVTTGWVTLPFVQFFLSACATKVRNQPEYAFRDRKP